MQHYIMQQQEKMRSQQQARQQPFVPVSQDELAKQREQMKHVNNRYDAFVQGATQNQDFVGVSTPVNPVREILAGRIKRQQSRPLVPGAQSVGRTVLRNAIR